MNRLRTALSRRWLLLAGSTAGLIALLWVQQQTAEQPVTLPAPPADIGISGRVENTAPAATSPPPAAATAPAQDQAAVIVADIFAVRTWEPAAPVDTRAEAPPSPPPPPQAPPLPFRYLGRIVEPGKNMAFLLAQGQKVISVSVGDAIDDTYNVVEYAGGQLHFLFLPMKVRQSLSVGSGEELSG